jgi:hypothetical protein
MRLPPAVNGATGSLRTTRWRAKKSLASVGAMCKRTADVSSPALTDPLERYGAVSPWPMQLVRSDSTYAAECTRVSATWRVGVYPA